MTGCSAVGCSNRTEQGYCMKVFPRDPKRRALWAAKVRRQNWVPTDRCFLCEVHFDADQWEKDRVDGKRKLKCYAVPTIFHHSPMHCKKEPPTEQKESSIMPNFCSAYGCSNTSAKASCREKGISFHYFPLNDKDRLKQWLLKIRRKNFKPSISHRLCSEHFTKEDFEYQSFTNRRELKKTAVPTKFCFTSTETPASPRTSYESVSRIVQNDICETETSSKEEKSTQTNDIFINQLLTEVEKLKTENAQLKTDVKIMTEYLIQLFENQ